MFEEVIDGVAAAKAQYELKAREAFGHVFKDFLAKHPAVKAIYWTQYTPYFNDGDECMFSINEIDFLDVDPTECDDIADVHDWQWRYDHAAMSYKDDPYNIASSARSLETFMVENDTVLQEIFGDHVSVLITSSGEAIVNEYEHD